MIYMNHITKTTHPGVRIIQRLGEILNEKANIYFMSCVCKHKCFNQRLLVHTLQRIYIETICIFLPAKGGGDTKVLVTPSSDFCCSCRGAIRACLTVTAHNLTHRFRIKLHFLSIISLETWMRKSSRFYSHSHAQNLRSQVRHFFLRYPQEILKWMACSSAMGFQQNKQSRALISKINIIVLLFQ